LKHNIPACQLRLNDGDKRAQKQGPQLKELKQDILLISSHVSRVLKLIISRKNIWEESNGLIFLFLIVIHMITARKRLGKHIPEVTSQQ
jgi:hypothetical protein